MSVSSSVTYLPSDYLSTLSQARQNLLAALPAATKKMERLDAVGQSCSLTFPQAKFHIEQMKLDGLICETFPSTADDFVRAIPLVRRSRLGEALHQGLTTCVNLDFFHCLLINSLPSFPNTPKDVIYSESPKGLTGTEIATTMGLLSGLSQIFSKMIELGMLVLQPGFPIVRTIDGISTSLHQGWSFVSDATESLVANAFGPPTSIASMQAKMLEYMLNKKMFYGVWAYEDILQDFSDTVIQIIEKGLAFLNERGLIDCNERWEGHESRATDGSIKYYTYTVKFYRRFRNESKTMQWGHDIHLDWVLPA